MLEKKDDFGYDIVVRRTLYLDHFGHEITGIVEKVGPGITRFSAGERVFLRGPKCSYEYSGVSEYCIAEEYKAAILPENVSFEEGVLGELLPIAIGGTRHVDIGDHVGIIGQGPAGLMLTHVAKLRGASKILVADKYDKRLRVSKIIGADITVNVTGENLEGVVKKEFGFSDLKNKGLDVVIDAVGTPDVLRECVRLVKPGGNVSIFGTHHLEPVLIDLVEWEAKGITVTMSNETKRVEVEERMEKARRLLEKGTINTGVFITHIFELKDLPKAFAILRDTPGEAIKIVIRV
jgi:alcohol dehydrogenase